MAIRIPRLSIGAIIFDAILSYNRRPLVSLICVVPGIISPQPDGGGYRIQLQRHEE